MSRDKDEDYMLVRDVPAFILKETGVKVSLEAVYLWIRKGGLNYMGKPIMLKHIRRVGKKYVTKRWVLDFISKK